MEPSADNSSAKANAPWLRRHAVALGVIVLLAVLYTLGGFLLVPHIARTQAVAYVQNDLHRKLTIGDLKFNPFTFAVEIHDLNLAEADGEPIAGLAMLHVEFNAWASVIHRAWTLADVKLQAPSVNVVINKDDSLNLEKLVPPSKEPAPAPKPSGSLPRVRIGLFSVHQGRVHFEDRSRDEQPFTATLTPIEFDLTDFRTQSDFENRYSLSAASTAGERFDWSGQFDLRPLSSTGEFVVSALKATTIASYLEDSLPCTLGSGTLDIKGQYQLVAQGTGGPAVTVTLPSLQVHALTIAPKDAAADAAPWVSLPELDVNDTQVVLSDRTASVGEITLQKPALKVWREADGSINLLQLAGPPKPATTAPVTPAAPAPAKAPSAPWKVTLAKLSIDQADIAVEDRSVKPAMNLHVAPLNVTVQNASSEGTRPLSFDVDTTLNASGHLHSAGTLTLTPMAAQVALDLKSLDLSAFEPYVTQQAQLSVAKGEASADLKIAYAAQPAKGQSQLKVTGAAQVTNLATRDNVTNADFITWSALEVTGLQYAMNPTSVAIDRVHARGLFTRVVIGPNGTINVKDVMGAPGSGTSEASPAATTPKPATPVPQRVTAKSNPQGGKGTQGATVSVAPAKSSAPPMPMRIKRIDIDQSTLNFADRSIEPNFSAGIVNLHGSITGLSSAAASRARITLDGQVDQFAPVQIRGEINPFAAMGYTDVSLSFHNVELTTFNPYSGKYAGYSIDQGKLSTDLHYHIDNRKLDATHHIVIDQLEFGAATQSKQAVPLPIKLAVAILKDRNGVITLDLPEITGTLDDPKFKVGPLIWTFVVDLMKKIVTAPFAALGHLFGGSGEEMKFVEFPIGGSALPDSQTDKLNKLASALVERPNLKLDLPLHAVVPEDDEALSKAALEQALTDSANEKKKSAKPVTGANADPAARLKGLTALYKQKFDKAPEYPAEDKSKNSDSSATTSNQIAWLERQLLPQYKPSADQRSDLGKARAVAVQTALLANKELNPERVFLTERESTGTDQGKVKMELQLQ